MVLKPPRCVYFPFWAEREHGVNPAFSGRQPQLRPSKIRKIQGLVVANSIRCFESPKGRNFPVQDELGAYSYVTIANSTLY